MAEPAPEVPEAAAAAAATGDDALYAVDAAATKALEANMLAAHRGGTMDVKHYTKVKLSGIAGAKILMHAKRGCDQGVAETSARAATPPLTRHGALRIKSAPRPRAGGGRSRSSGCSSATPTRTTRGRWCAPLALNTAHRAAH